MNNVATKDEVIERIKMMSPEDALGFLYNFQKKNDKKYIKILIDKYIKLKRKKDSERTRFLEMSSYEKKAREDGYKYIAGVDEAGRGPLAGPVVAACVILPEDIFIEGLNDSKQLSLSKREYLFDIIRKKAVSWGVGIIDQTIIDRVNILNATKMAVKQAVKSTDVEPGLLLLDALRISDIDIEQVSIIKGDCKSISIAAASVMAKVTRDRILVEIDSIYPQYGFKKHKGYGTRDHMDAIKKYGICPIHRMSFTKMLL